MTEARLRNTSARVVLACSLVTLTNVMSAFAQPTAIQAPAAVPQPPPRANDAPIVRLFEGRLTLKVQNVRLAWILNQLTTQMKLVVQLAPGAGNELVTADLQDAPLEDTLRQLLRKNDAFFFYGSDTAQDAALQILWVYPKGKAAGLQPVPPEDWASTKELQAATANDDPQVRLNAIVAVIDRVGDVAMPLALHAMTTDSDADVRAMALFAARSKGLHVAPEVLSGLLASDSSESVRFLALEGLARDPNARFYAENAMRDPSPGVRQKAQEILNQLEAAARRKSGAPQQVKRPRQ